MVTVERNARFRRKDMFLEGGGETVMRESVKKKRKSREDEMLTDRLRVCLRSLVTRCCVRKHTSEQRLHHKRQAANDLLHELQVDATLFFYFSTRYLE